MGLNFNEWLQYGYENNWISDVFCNTHDGPPMTDEESLWWDEGQDPCSFHVRVWELD